MYLVQTVQTSWRPQLPLPKDYPPAANNTTGSTESPSPTDTNSPTSNMDKAHHTPKHPPPLAGSHQHHTAPAELPAGNRNNNNNNKWSLGGLFRRKKKSDAPDGDNSAGDSSSDEAANRSSSNKDKSTAPKSRSRARRAGHKLKEAFDHIVVTPLADRHKQPPAHPQQHQHLQQPQQPHQQRLTATPPESIRSGGSGSLDRRLRRERIRAARVYSRDPDQQAGSSDEALATIDGDAISHNSLSSMSRFRSDESLANSAGSGSHRRSRSARTERYLKRMSKGDDGSLGGGSGHGGSGRWQTQPVQYSHQQQQLNQAYVPAHHVNQMYNAHATPIVAHQPLRSSASMSHVPSQSNANWNVPMRPKYPPPADAAIPNNRSISYEAHLHQLNRTGQQQQQQQQYANPPPPPPRDPQRRLTMNAGVPEQARPVSYAFDAHHHPHQMQSVQQQQQQQNIHGPPLALRMPARCVSDDRLWGTNDSRGSSQYSTTFALPQPQAVNPQRRFITRNSDVPPVPNAVAASAASAFRYVADAAPRSRRPIHLVNSSQQQPQAGKPSAGTPAQSTEPRILRTGKSGLPTLASPMKNAADFWKKLDKESASPSPSKLQMKPRSVSHSRVHAPAGRYHTQESVDHVDGVVTGSLVLKPSRSCVFQPTATNRYELSAPATADSKVESLPSYYTPKKEPTVNKYDEHVAKNIAAPPQPFKYGAAKPFAYIAAADLTPPTSASATILKPIGASNRKSTNLEDAINELEAIYKSLRLDNDPQLLDRAERRDLTSTLDQTSAAAAAARYAPASSSDIDSDSPGGAAGAGEPDVLLDDVVYRNLKRANSIPRTVEAQPMFGIPIGPIAPSPVTDYLHAESTSVRTSRPMFVAQKSPDPVADDLAVRLLRKDVAMAAMAAASQSCLVATQVTPRGRTRPTTTTTATDDVDSPASSASKKMRAVRSMSANIYSLIQRDAAKPSGGCLEDYSQLERATKLGSLNDIASDVSDHPSTLFMLQRERKLSESAAEAEARSQPTSTSRGAVFNLPSTLRSSPRTSPVKPPMPLPRSPSRASSQPAETPSDEKVPLTDNSGMNDILNAIAREAQESSAKLSRDLYELRNEIKAQQQQQQQTAKMNDDIERAAEEAQQCLSVLQDVVKDEPTEKPALKKRVDNEERMMRDIQSVGDAAKKCEKVLESALDKQPRIAAPINPQPKEECVAHEEEPTSIAKLLEKLEPESRKIGAIAERCMRQLSQLGDMHDEIFGKQAKPIASSTGDYDNLHASLYGSPKPSTSQASSSAEIVHVPNKCKPTVQEELDKIMAECAEEAEKLSQPIIKVEKYEHENEKPKSDDDDDEDNEEMNIILLPPNALTPTQPYEERTVACCSSTVTFDDNLPVPDPTARTETNTSASKSSSDDRKSSSNTPNRAHSSSITSFNAQSSSDYGKSLSVSATGSEEVKSNSTTSCDVRSTTTNATTTSTTNDSSLSNRSPSPLRLTPSGDERSLYNSSEELAMIFGIRSEGSTQNRQPQSGKSSASSSGTATTVSPSSPATATTATVTVTPACASATHQHASATISPPTAPQQHHTNGNESAISPSDIRSAFVSLATILEAHEEFHTHLDQLDMDETDRMSPLYKSSGVNIGGLMAASGETSYSSMESIESTPDSGNHSLNDYPMTTVASTTTTTTTPTTTLATVTTIPEATDSYTFRSELTINTAEVHQIEPVFTSELSIEHSPEETRFLKELSHCEEVTIAIEPEAAVKAVAVAADTIASIEERFNDIYDELVEINDEFFRCSTSLSLTTIHEDDERDFERLVREECGDLRFDEDTKSASDRAETSQSPIGAEAAQSNRGVLLAASTSRLPFTSSNVTEAVPVDGGVNTMEPNHLLWACTLALADSDLLTLLAIVVAIITILALILF